MAFWYSVRLRRRSVSVRPGFGAAAAASSSEVSSQDTSAPLSAAEGWGRVDGGMVPVRSLRMTFSQTSAPSCAFATSTCCNDNPAVSSRSL